MSDFHHAALDAHPDDAAARLLLAEYLDERGDPDAAGYRWMGERAKRPHLAGWSWGNHPYIGLRLAGSTIPNELLYKLKGGQIERFSRLVWVEFPTRRAAELALCQAVSELVSIAYKLPIVTLENSSQD